MGRLSAEHQCAAAQSTIHSGRERRECHRCSLPLTSAEHIAYLGNSAEYPRLQGNWGNQASIRSLPGVGTQCMYPYQKLESLQIWHTIFGTGRILCKQSQTSNLRGSTSDLNWLLVEKFPNKSQGSKSWWGKLPHFPQWWIRPWGNDRI